MILHELRRLMLSTKTKTKSQMIHQLQIKLKSAKTKKLKDSNIPYHSAKLFFENAKLFFIISQH